LPPLCASTTAGGFPSSIAAFCDAAERLEESIVPVERLPRSLLRRNGFKQLLSLIEESDLVHIHGLWQSPSLLGGWLSRRCQTPYVVSAHGMLEPWALRTRRWKKSIYAAATERRTLARAACLRALTCDEVSDYRAFGLTNPIAVVPNGVHIPDTGPELFLDAFPTMRGRRLLLYLGRIHYKKGPDVLVKAWGLVAKRFPEVQLVIAGPDFERTEAAIKELAARLGVSDTITFAGLLRGDLKWSALAACSLFVLPSHSEGFSVAVLEALGSGKPVLISPQCHFPDVIERNCGWIVEPNVDRISELLAVALQMPPNTLADMGARGRALVQQKYDWNEVGSQMAGVYRWVLGGPKPQNVPIFC
jgi:glycosyltransferase involved in cell wall biosynthesis